MGVGAEEDMLEKNNSNEKNDKVTFEWCGCSWDLVETLNFRDENRKEEVLKAWQEQVAFIFDTCMLCTLSTCARSDSDMYSKGAGKTAESQDGNESCSHVFFDNYPETSLMFYAWCKEENAIVFTTPSKNDLKYKNIMKNQHVSILLHNYCGNSATKAMLHSMPGMSITAYGSARPCQSSGESLFYKNILETRAACNNSSAYTGEGTVLMKVDIEGLLLVNIFGEVLRLIRMEKAL